MLALEVEWLTGVCFATRGPTDVAPEWPPQPDRIFSALVATWGAHDEPPEERRALEWLEELDPPRLEAAEAHPRVAVTAFVPPNDMATLPNRRRCQPRRFPASIIAATPGEPHLRLVWDSKPALEHFPALQSLARDTSFIGHSSALVRCNFLSMLDTTKTLTPHKTRAAPYRGRLKALEGLYRRHQDKSDANARPRPALVPHVRSIASLEPALSVFGHDWTILSASVGDRPDLRAAAAVARVMRDALMSGFGDQIPEWLSGHTVEGAPTVTPHLAIVPLAHVGFEHSDGRLMGLALIVPRASENAWATPANFEERRALSRALARLSKQQNDDDVIELRLGASGIWLLRAVPTADQSTLDPRRYCRTAATWSSVTPIALDRHPKAKGTMRLKAAAEIVAESCVRIGLPLPVSVRVHKHAAISGAPSAWPPGGTPAWTGWARPKALANRPLFHATLEFAEPVVGPVILGAGRFFGLGLCLPVRREKKP